MYMSLHVHFTGTCVYFHVHVHVCVIIIKCNTGIIYCNILCIQELSLTSAQLEIKQMKKQLAQLESQAKNRLGVYYWSKCIDDHYRTKFARLVMVVNS